MISAHTAKGATSTYRKIRRSGPIRNLRHAKEPTGVRRGDAHSGIVLADDADHAAVEDLVESHEITGARVGVGVVRDQLQAHVGEQQGLRVEVGDGEARGEERGCAAGLRVAVGEISAAQKAQAQRSRLLQRQHRGRDDRAAHTGGVGGSGEPQSRSNLAPPEMRRRSRCGWSWQ